VVLHARAAAEVAEHDDGDVGVGGRHDFARLRSRRYAAARPFSTRRRQDAKTIMTRSLARLRVFAPSR
jgi:hypothetical protein